MHFCLLPEAVYSPCLFLRDCLLDVIFSVLILLYSFLPKHYITSKNELQRFIHLRIHIWRCETRSWYPWMLFFVVSVTLVFCLNIHYPSLVARFSQKIYISNPMTGGDSKDELLGKFFAALDKINFFKTSQDEVEDPAQLAKATKFFNDALMVCPLHFFYASCI